MSIRCSPTFEQFLRDARQSGRLVNAVFEERIYHLVGILTRITDALTADHIPYELVGGLAVLAHIQDVAPDGERTTKDVDLMINRGDLQRLVAAAAQFGFRFRDDPRIDMLMSENDDTARNAVHLIYAGESNRPDQLLPNPELRPVRKMIRGRKVMVVPLPDLVRMKLTAFRLKDQVHVQSLDRTGLITPEISEVLPPSLKSRLQHVRDSE